MNHPPYHLRLNKAIDRFMLLDVMRKLERICDLSEYTYYSLGGPYLEEFRALYETFPEIGMVSIEQEPETLKRQRFHRPCKKLQLAEATMKSFAADYDAKDKKSIFWLDYTKLDLGVFEEFQVLLGKVAANSIIKVTLQAMPKYYRGETSAKFKTEFGAFMPDPLADPPLILDAFLALLQNMVQISAQQILPATLDMTFQPLTSFWYDDGTTMFTLTGIVCKRAEQKEICSLFKGWQFANLNWNAPKQINIPFLSTKERLQLQKHLPVKQNTGLRLLDALGYNIGSDKRDSIEKLKQYADFYRYFPYFMKAEP